MLTMDKICSIIPVEENIIVKLNMQNIQEGEKEEDNIDLQDSNNEEEENDDESDKDIENEAFMKINDSQNLEETFDPQKYNPIMKKNERKYDCICMQTWSHYERRISQHGLG